MLNITDLNKSYKNKKIVNSVNLTIEKGSVFGVFGNENSGKTTLLRLILGVIKKDSGQVIFEDKELQIQKVNISYLPQKSNLYEDVTIYNQLKLFCELKKSNKKDIEKNIDYWLKKFEIKNLKNEKYFNLSREDKHKVKLISLLINNPEIIILDEPFRSIGFIGIFDLKNILIDLKKEGKIIIIASQYLNYIEEICDDIAFMYNGVLTEFGDTKYISSNEFVDEVLIRTNNCGEDKYFIENLLSVEKVLDITEKDIIIKLADKNTPEDLVKDLFNKGINFSAVYPRKKSLEDIYMEEFRREITKDD